jgi:hypothetical protein
MLSKLIFAVLLTACSDAALSNATPAPTKTDTTSSASAQVDEESGDYELAHLRANRTPRRIEKFDTNKDGMLQASEVPARLHDWFVKVDANKDNVVTADEIRAYNRAHPHPHRHHGGNRDGGAGHQHETTTL